MAEEGIGKKRLDIYKEAYYYELSRKAELSNDLTLPVGVVTVMLSSVAYLMQKADSVKGTIPFFLMLLGFTVMVVSVMACIYFLIRSYYNYSYEYFASTIVVEKHYNDLKLYYESISESSKKADEHFEQYMIDTYCKCIDTNIKKNDKKSDFLHNARTSMVIALIAAMVTLGAGNYNKMETMSLKAKSYISNKGVKKNVSNKIPKSTHPAFTTATSTH